MGNLGILLWALLAVTSSSVAQRYGQQNTLFNGGRESSSSALSCRGACPCPQEFIPFCATDGRQETTYINKCQYECARRCNPSLKIRFEGVCAKPYVHRNGENGWDSTSSSSQYRPNIVSPPIIVTTRRPGRYGSQSQYQPQIPSRYPSGSSYVTQPTTRPPYSSGSSGYRPGPTTRPPYNSGYQPQQTTRPPYSSGYQPTTRPPYSSGYQPTTRPPYSSGYQTQQTTRSPYPTDSSGYGPRPQSTPSYPSYEPYQTSTTSKPWWQGEVARSRYPPQATNQVAEVDWRKSRDADDDDIDQDEEEDDYDGDK